MLQWCKVRAGAHSEWLDSHTLRASSRRIHRLQARKEDLCASTSSVCVARCVPPVPTSSATAATPRASPSRPGPERRPSSLLDAGTGIRAVTGMLEGAPFRGTILVSHVHWDHVQGLPFFAAGDRAGASVRLVLPAQGGKSGRDLIAQTMSPPAFPITPEGLIGAWTFDAVHPGALEVEGFSVRAFEVAHKGGRTYGYTVRQGVELDRLRARPRARARGLRRRTRRAGGGRLPRPRRAVPRARAAAGGRLRARHGRRRDPPRRTGAAPAPSCSSTTARTAPTTPSTRSGGSSRRRSRSSSRRRATASTWPERHDASNLRGGVRRVR